MGKNTALLMGKKNNLGEFCTNISSKKEPKQTLHTPKIGHVSALIIICFCCFQKILSHKYSLNSSTIFFPQTMVHICVVGWERAGIIVLNFYFFGILVFEKSIPMMVYCQQNNANRFLYCDNNKNITYCNCGTLLIFLYKKKN